MDVGGMILLCESCCTRMMSLVTCNSQIERGQTEMAKSGRCVGEEKGDANGPLVLGMC